MLTVGTLFHNRYQVERQLGSGGMGAVYEVLDRKTARRRALKVMLPDTISDPDLRTRFEHEATITAQVDSEHLVEVFDAGIDDETGIPFIAMELLKGEELGRVLAHRRQLPPPEVISLLHQASQALDRTHALGIVHRDLKPENLFITHRDDGTSRLRILDFGIAKLQAQSTRAKTTGVVGTPLYMAPEQALGDAGIGPTADLYALGHIAFALLVGEPFWEEAARHAPSPVVLLAKVAQGATESASQRASTLGAALPPAFDEWFAQATARSPHDRFETASELVEALAVALSVPLPGDGTRHPRSSDAIHAAAAAAFPLPDVPTTQSAVSSDLRTTPRRATVTLLLAGLAVVVVSVALGTLLVRRPLEADSGKDAARASAWVEAIPSESNSAAPPTSATKALPVSDPAFESPPTAAPSRRPTPLVQSPVPTPRRASGPSPESADAPFADVGRPPDVEAKPQSEPDTPPSDPSDIF